MLDVLLKYVALISIIVSFLPFLQWLIQRKREQEDKHSESFHRMIALASGASNNEIPIKMPQQIAAIYQLQRYPEYKFASIPVLEMLQEDFKVRKQHQDQDKHLIKAINETLKVLSSIKNKKMSQHGTAL